MHVHEVTLPLHPDMVTCPGDPAFEREPVKGVCRGSPEASLPGMRGGGAAPARVWLVGC